MVKRLTLKPRGPVTGIAGIWNSSRSTPYTGPSIPIYKGHGISPMTATHASIRALLQTTQLKKEKKMSWLKKIITRWAREVYEGDPNTTESPMQTPSAKTSIRFTLYPASGGWVIEHTKLDRYQDGDGPSLTIIQHGEEIGKAVEHIISMESLRS